MPWLTRMLGRPIVDTGGKVLGRIEDLLAERGRFPRVTRAAIRLRPRGKQLLGSPNRMVFIPWSAIDVDDGRGRLGSDPAWQEEVSTFELHLSADLLDRQIIDTDGARVVRVNDVWLAESADGLRVVGADVGVSGVLRRLGVEGPARHIASALGYEIPQRLIGWNYIAPLDQRRGQVRLTIPTRQLRELHPSEVADILDDLDPEKRERILRVMSDNELAETLGDVEPETSREAVAVLGEERVRRVLALMPPDEATDLLGALSYDAAERLLGLMGVREASVIRELLGYAPDTAGGRMTPSFVAVDAGATAQESIERIRREASRAETIYYAYVLDADSRLKGVLSLRQLLRAPSDRKVEEIMETDFVSALVTDDQEQVARAMARYDLLALPVTDEEGRLRGIVTVDDIVEVLEEEASEDLAEVTGVYLGEGPGVRTGRLAGFGLSLVAGALAAALLESSSPGLRAVAPVAWLLPLYLRVAQDLGTWSLARALVVAGLDPRRRLDVLSQELLAALASAAACGVLVGLFGRIWTGSPSAGIFLGVGIFVGSLAASLMGMVLPALAKSLGLTTLLARGRLLAVTVGMTALLVYVWSLGSLASRLP
ncbi:MAG: magnesium transporter MgtE N-terminal domain-containing protein [Actinomycetota bacterium]